MINLYNEYFSDMGLYDCIVYSLSDIEEFEHFEDIRSTVIALRDIDFKDKYYTRYDYKSYGDEYDLECDHLNYYRGEVLVWLLEKWEYEVDGAPTEDDTIGADATLDGLIMGWDLEPTDLQYSLERGFCEIVRYDEMYYLTGDLLSKGGF